MDFLFDLSILGLGMGLETALRGSVVVEGILQRWHIPWWYADLCFNIHVLAKYFLFGYSKQTGSIKDMPVPAPVVSRYTDPFAAQLRQSTPIANASI